MRSYVLNFVPIKRRPRATTTGKHVRLYTDSQTIADEKAVSLAYHGELYTCPVVLEVHVFRCLPKATPKRVASQPDVIKPDLDNIIKAIMDGLNGKAYVDDSQVVEIRAYKHPRTHKPGDSVRFRVYPSLDREERTYE